MAKETEISNHTSTKDAIIYVIEGEGQFNLQGKEIEMLPGVIINVVSNTIHAVKANKNLAFLIFQLNYFELRNYD
jgi:nitric oxide dioxygenase